MIELYIDWRSSNWKGDVYFPVSPSPQGASAGVTSLCLMGDRKMKLTANAEANAEELCQGTGRHENME